MLYWGSGCGAVGRAVVPDTRGPQFESSHRKLLYLCASNRIEKTKIKKKRPGIVQFFDTVLYDDSHELHLGQTVVVWKIRIFQNMGQASPLFV